MCLVFEYPFYRRYVIFQKFAAGQTIFPIAGEPELTYPELTHVEAIWLNTLSKEIGPGKFVVPVMLAAMAAWMPATFAPMAVVMVPAFLARCALRVRTQSAGRVLHIVRWAAMLLAAVVPPLYRARSPWNGAIMLAFYFYLFDYRNIALRRKLPVEQWPARLYW